MKLLIPSLAAAASLTPCFIANDLCSFSQISSSNFCEHLPANGQASTTLNASAPRLLPIDLQASFGTLKTTSHICVFLGYLALVPDFFEGDEIGKYPERQEFFKVHPLSAAYPQVDAVLEQIKKDYGGIPVGIEGFCWGGHFALRVAGEATHVQYCQRCLTHANAWSTRLGMPSS